MWVDNGHDEEPGLRGACFASVIGEANDEGSSAWCALKPTSTMRAHSSYFLLSASNVGMSSVRKPQGEGAGLGVAIV